MNSATLCHC